MGPSATPRPWASSSAKSISTFPTGTQYLYSNSGYFLLSQIVKRVSGKSLRDFAAENIFRPLEMTTAEFRDDHTALIKNRAYGYSARGAGFRLDNPNFDVVGAGGLFLTVRDFLRWDQNFYDARVGGRDFVTQLQTPGRLNDGSPISPTPYAFGLLISQFEGVDLVSHDGAYGGFRAAVLRFPQQHLSIVCLGNLSSLQPGPLARQVARLYLKPAPAPTLPAGTAPTAGKKASAPKPAYSLPAEKIPEYAGDFFSEELQATYRIEISSGQLVLHGGRSLVVRLTATGPDAFTLTGVDLAFKRDSAGKIAGFALNAGRVRGIDFVLR
jgi:CubicO group peptidase (beta-lactamase class C family)